MPRATWLPSSSRLYPNPAVSGALTVQVSPNAPRGSVQFVTIGPTAGTGVEFSAGINITIATEPDGGGTGPPPPRSDLYRRFQRDISPPWLQTERGKAFQQELGSAKDRIVDLLVASLRARTLALAPPDALTQLGEERGLPRYPAEDIEPYRRRLLAAWDFWRWAGTKKGIEDALRVLGYVPQVFENFLAYDNTVPVWSDDGVWEDDGTQWALARWAEFNVILRPGSNPQGSTPWADDGVWADDGSLWGTQLTLAEVGRILGVLNQVKAAHTVYNTVLYVIGGTIWGEESEGDWQDDGLWEDGEVIELYRRN